MNKKFNGTYSYQKDIGKVRVSNEDESLVIVNADGDVLMMVADGMGGHQKGDYASLETINYLKDLFQTKGKFFNQLEVVYWLKKAIKEVNNHIFSISDNNSQYSGMGTTLVLAFLYKNKLIVANCGDSRCYIYNKKDELIQLTEDQTYVNYLYRSGQIKKEEILTHPKRHVLTNAIGIFPSLSIDIKVLNYGGEKILLCSDGLYNNVKESDIQNVLHTDQTTQQKVASLINIANYNGGSDNISLALWESLNDED